LLKLTEDDPPVDHRRDVPLAGTDAGLVEVLPGSALEAVFDLDPAGIRIASLLQQRTGVRLQSAAMTPEVLERAPARLALTDWDRSELVRLAGRDGALEPLRRALVETDRKVEQETIQRQLPDLFRVRVAEPP